MYIMYKIRGIMLLQATVRLGLCVTVDVSEVLGEVSSGRSQSLLTE